MSVRQRDGVDIFASQWGFLGVSPTELKEIIPFRRCFEKAWATLKKIKNKTARRQDGRDLDVLEAWLVLFFKGCYGLLHFSADTSSLPHLSDCQIFWSVGLSYCSTSFT